MNPPFFRVEMTSHSILCGKLVKYMKYLVNIDHSTEILSYDAVFCREHDGASTIANRLDHCCCLDISDPESLLRTDGH